MNVQIHLDIHNLSMSDNPLEAACGRLAKHIMEPTRLAVAEEMDRDTPSHILFEALINLHVSLLEAIVAHQYEEEHAKVIKTILARNTQEKLER
jgi:hypothetical protein